MEISKEKCCLITENAKNYNIMPTDELSKLLGVDFYEVFKPSSVFNERIELEFTILGINSSSNVVFCFIK